MSTKTKLKTCPLCGRKIEVYGPEDWRPTYYDPDSGGDPYLFSCECGLSFCIPTYDYEEMAKAWNTRVKEDKYDTKCGHWIKEYSVPDGDVHYICSICGSSSDFRFKHCPNCGIKMVLRDKQTKQA